MDIWLNQAQYAYFNIFKDFSTNGIAMDVWLNQAQYAYFNIFLRLFH